MRWGDTRPDGLPGLTPPPATLVRSEGPVRPRQAGKGRGRAVNPANSSCRKGCAARRRVSSRRSASKSPPGEAGHRRQRPVHPSRHFGMTISAVVVASSRTSVPGFGLGHIGTEPPRDHWVWGCPGGGGASPSPRKARGGQKRGARQNLCLHLPASGLGHRSVSPCPRTRTGNDSGGSPDSGPCTWTETTPWLTWVSSLSTAYRGTCPPPHAHESVPYSKPLFLLRDGRCVLDGWTLDDR